MSELGVAVWGAGWVSGEHVKAWESVPQCRVVAIGSRKEASARKVAAETGVDAKIYADENPERAYEQLLQDPAVNVVSICTPNHLHAREGILAAQAGKHICLEKPIAIHLDELRQLREAVNKAQVKTVVSFVLRWNPLFENIKALLAQNAIGNIFYAEVDYWHGIGDWYTGWEWVTKKSSGASAFLAAGCHAVDAIRWFVGSEIAEVAAYANSSTGQYEYPPNVIAALKFADGTIGKIAVSFECQMPYNFNIDLLGTQGTMRGNKLYSKVLLPGQTNFAEIPTILPDSGDVAHHPFKGEMAHFAQCIRANTESHCNVEDAYKTHEVCLAVDRSLETGQPVKLPLA
jgi:predicted dehydrogenase